MQPKPTHEEIEHFFRWCESWSWHSDPTLRPPLHKDTLRIVEHCILPYLRVRTRLNFSLSRRDEVVSAIIDAIFREPSPFRKRQPFHHHEISGSVCYFALLAQDSVLKILQPAHPMLSLETLVEQQGEKISMQDQLWGEEQMSVNNVEDAFERKARRADLMECFRNALGDSDRKVLALFLLSDAAGYSWTEIGQWLGLSTQEKEGGAEQIRAATESIWNEFREDWELPDCNTVAGWFPPPPTVNALTTFYSRALAQIKRHCALC